MTTIQSLGTVVRKWNDLSSKWTAMAAGGVTAGGVTSILAALFPHWHPATWVVALITLGVALLFGYLRGDKVALGATVTATAADGTATSTAAVVPLPDVSPEVLALLQKANATVGTAEAEQAAGPDDDGPKHAAS